MPFGPPEDHPAARPCCRCSAGLAFFVVLGLALWGVAAGSRTRPGRSKVQVNLGEDTFDPGAADGPGQGGGRGGPLLFPGWCQPGRGLHRREPRRAPTRRLGWKAYSPPCRRGGPASASVQWQRRRASSSWTRAPGTTLPGRRHGARPRYLDSVDGDRELVIDLHRRATGPRHHDGGAGYVVRHATQPVPGTAGDALRRVRCLKPHALRSVAARGRRTSNRAPPSGRVAAR